MERRRGGMKKEGKVGWVFDEGGKDYTSGIGKVRKEEKEERRKRERLNCF